MTSEINKMTGIWELTGYNKHTNFFQFCHAYINSAYTYAKQIADESRKPSYPESCVIQFLAYHATELFLKGGILKSSPSGVPASHNIYELYDQYQSYYAHTEASFDMPFKVEYLGEDREKTKEKSIHNEPGHLLFRYPINRNGDDWKTLVGFTLYDYIKLIENLKNNFIILEGALTKL